MDRKFKVPGSSDRYAFLIEKGADSEFVAKVMEEAALLRAKGACVLVSMMNKNKKFQKEQLAEQGYTDIREFFKD